MVHLSPFVSLGFSGIFKSGSHTGKGGLCRRIHFSLIVEIAVALVDQDIQIQVLDEENLSIMFPNEYEPFEFSAGSFNR